MIQTELLGALYGHSRPDPEQLEALLSGRDWLSARDIAAETGWSDRLIRAMASVSDQIGSGNRGYRLISQMTREEYDEFRGRILRQADEMKARIARCDRVFFGRKPA